MPSKARHEALSCERNGMWAAYGDGEQDRAPELDYPVGTRAPKERSPVSGVGSKVEAGLTGGRN